MSGAMLTRCNHVACKATFKLLGLEGSTTVRLISALAEDSESWKADTGALQSHTSHSFLVAGTLKFHSGFLSGI
jgi:hypothetical protein